MTNITTNITPIIWTGAGLKILDQRRLPVAELYLDCATVDTVAEAIVALAVRGAPLIGITAAYGLAIAAREAGDRVELEALRQRLYTTRPTAVNLHWALDRGAAVIAALSEATMAELHDALLALARQIHADDAASCLAMARAGAELIPAGARILTHCNTGALATGGIGTALGVIRAAHAQGKVKMVWVDETRPLLQGARLTTWELQRDGIPFTLNTDSMAASLMAAGQVDAVIVGADRITRNGDFANKIGTYSLAVLAHAHNIPFYVAAPRSTFDMTLADGTQIPVEFRAANEVTDYPGIAIYNPSFDVTPGRLVTRFVTEEGISV